MQFGCLSLRRKRISLSMSCHFSRDCLPPYDIFLMATTWNFKNKKKSSNYSMSITSTYYPKAPDFIGSEKLLLQGRRKFWKTCVTKNWQTKNFTRILKWMKSVFDHHTLRSRALVDLQSYTRRHIDWSRWPVYEVKSWIFSCVSCNVYSAKLAYSWNYGYHSI